MSVSIQAKIYLNCVKGDEQREARVRGKEKKRRKLKRDIKKTIIRKNIF